MFSILFCIIYSVIANLNIELGRTYYDMLAPWQGDTRYKLFDLKLEEVIQGEDLILVVKPLSALGDPNIYISTTQNEPNENSAEIKCESAGLDICQITTPKAATYHIAVYCEGFCRFSLKAVYQKELQMTNDDDMEFKLVDSWTEIIKINVSQITDSFYSSPQKMEIQVRIRNFDILQESFKSFLNKGELVPTTSENDYKGEDTYSGMQKFKINAVAIGEIYTLTVETQAGAIVEIQTRTYGEIRSIRLGEKIEDVVLEGNIQCYCLDLKNETKAKAFPRNYLNIQLLPYKGYAELYVHFDKQPPFLNQYTWKLQDKVTDDLVITEEDVQKYNITGNQVFIAVVGNKSNVTYELKSQLVDPNLMILELNKPTTGKLENDKKIQYEFFIRGNKQNTVSVTLRNIIGDADIVMKQCESIWSCKVSDDELLKRQEKVNYQAGSLFMYSDEPGNDIIVFDNKPGECQQYGNTYQCYYAVLIHPGKDNKVEELTYSILITTKSEIITLRENTPLKQIVNDQLYNHYKFHVDEQDQIKRLMIQITPIQGQPKLYYSKTEVYPVKEKHDLQGVQNVLIFGGRDGIPVEPGTYYIGVFGYTASQYIITVMLFRNYGDWSLVGKYPNQYIQLLEGDPQDITTNQQEIQLFKIDLSQFYDEVVEYHQAVEITLRVIQGDYTLYGFDHPDIDISNAFIQGENQLTLPADSKIYPQYLYIRVESKPQLSSNLYSYQIFYRISSQPIELILANNYQGFISATEYQTFFLNYFKNENLIITKHIEDHDQSLLKVQVFIGKEVIQMSDTTLSIDSQMLKYEECKTEATEIIKCQILMQVTSKIDQYFSLIVTREESIVKLYDSEPVTRKIRDIPDYYTFIVSGNETEIAVFSVSGELNILVSIIEGRAPVKEDFPKDDNTGDLQSLRDDQDIGSSLFIPKETLDIHKCSVQLCYAAVTVIKIFTSDSRGEYTITRSSSVIPLSEGHSYYGQAKSQKMKYFKTSPIPKYEGLMVIVTPLSQGNIILLASENEMPTIDKFDYNSNTIAGDQLTIEPKKDASGEEKITYYIGVYTFEDVNFSIQINIGNVHFYELKRRRPFNFILDPNSIAYLNYYHTRDQGFKILFTNNDVLEYGKPKIYVTTYQEMNQQSQAINQTAESYKWTNVKSYLDIINRDSKFCQNCYYLILINNTYQENDITVTIAMEGEDILLLDNMEQQNILSDVNQTYLYHPDINGSFFINVTLIYGKGITVFGDLSRKDPKPVKLSELNSSLVREGFYANQSIYINQSVYANESYPIYKITVQGDSGSVYKIECISDQIAIELKVGETQTLKIRSSKTAYLYFVIPMSSLAKSKQYSLTVETYGHSEKLRKQQAHHPRIKIQRDLNNNPYYANNNHLYEPVDFLAQNETEQFLYFEFPDFPGLYMIEITPKEISELPYLVTLGNSELNLLVPRLQKFVSSKVGQMRLWELNILEPSKVFIQARLCSGVVNIFGSSSLEQLSQGGYQNKIENRFNKQIMGSFEINNTGPYYLGSKVTKSYQNLPKSSYTLSVFLFKPNTIIPAEHFEPGDGGEISSIFDGNNITVTFSPMRLEEKSSQDYQISSIIYYLIYEKQQLLDTTPLSQCEIGAKYDYTQVLQRNYKPNELLILSQQIGDDFEQVLFTIHARVYLRSNNYEDITLDYYYNTNTIKQQNKNLYYKQKREWTKGGITVLVTILLMVIVFLYIKNRKLRARFEFTEQNQQQLVRQEQAIEMNYTNMQ